MEQHILFQGYSSPNISRVMPLWKFWSFFCFQLTPLTVHVERWIIQESVYVLHHITCQEHIMPLLAELLSKFFFSSLKMLEIKSIWFKGRYTLLGETTVKTVLHPFRNSLPLEQTAISEGYWCKVKHTGSHKSCHSCEKKKKKRIRDSTKCIRVFSPFNP